MALLGRSSLKLALYQAQDRGTDLDRAMALTSLRLLRGSAQKVTRVRFIGALPRLARVPQEVFILATKGEPIVLLQSNR